MLSYRHGFHAGNFADVLKHLVLVNAIEYMLRKPAPILYIDTHAGGGLYNLTGAMAEKTGEAQAGVLSLDFELLKQALNAEAVQAFSNYETLIAPSLQQSRYPGSPALAAKLLRRGDRLACFELHATDLASLQNLMKNDRRVQCHGTDGFLSAKALLPPVQGRAVVMIDPSYELKDDYRKVVKYLETAYKRMPSATLLLWYPVVQRSLADQIVRSIRNGGLRDVWQFELGLKPHSADYGMTASGIIAVNPPWQMPDQLRNILPAIKSQLAPEAGNWRVENLIKE